ncbi:MAG: sugar ABC transporter ATP-binding protein [Bacillota bacterium]
MSAGRELLLELRGISKHYPGVVALNKVDFALLPGEVHALLGENGAGKSTLMKILAGTVQKDEGTIRVGGEAVEITGPHHSQELGIGMVFQELSLVPTLTVAENIFLGRWPQSYGRVRWEVMEQTAREILGRLGADISPRQVVRSLSMAEQQLVEIAKVLSREVKVLLLDEPTSALSQAEAEHLFALVDRLRSDGVGIIYVTHRLGEVMAICDRITVLRDGQRVAEAITSEVDEAALVRMMVGRELARKYPKEHVTPGPVLLRAEGICSQTGLKEIKLELRAGEILGVFGAMGAGRTELARVLFGLDRPTAGRLFVDGQEFRLRTPEDAIRAGIGYLPEDRRQGLVLGLPIPPNVTLASLRRISWMGFLSRSREIALAQKMVQDLRVATSGLDQRVGNLSGGNQQKIALARWIVDEARVLIFDEPTRGIDVGAKAEVYALLSALAKRGAAIMILSSELPEVLGVADRILVMQRGRIMSEFDRETATAEVVLHAAVGAEVNR